MVFPYNIIGSKTKVFNECKYSYAIDLCCPIRNYIKYKNSNVYYSLYCPVQKTYQANSPSKNIVKDLFFLQFIHIVNI